MFERIYIPKDQHFSSPTDIPWAVCTEHIWETYIPVSKERLLPYGTHALY